MLNRNTPALLLVMLFAMAYTQNFGTGEDILDPVVLRNYMFKKQITGEVNVLLPSKQNWNLNGTLAGENYEVDMVKTKQQFLPKELFNQTTIYAYAGKTKNGYRSSFPGPAIVATKNVPVSVKWRNNIPGPHILPVDYNHPFESGPAFRDEVPTVAHVHGVATKTSSDGGPEGYFTRNGQKSEYFETEAFCGANEAVYHYPNEQDAGNNWYHDHAMGITRLNVYAGLAGLYKIVDPGSKQEKRVVERFGLAAKQQLVKYLIVTDKTFKTNGQLYYSDSTTNPNYSSWVPEFYGNTMLVNGVLWPKMSLGQGKYRFVFLNACQNRYLNIWFENNGKKIPIHLIRADSDYYDEDVVVDELLATIATRWEFVIDFGNVQGEVVIKNNAAAPYPSGEDENLVPEFTGQIMKFVLPILYDPFSASFNSLLQNIPTALSGYLSNLPNLTPSAPYPFFAEGQKVFATLFQVMSETGEVEAMFIDGVSMMMNGVKCVEGSTFKVGKTYDFYIINLSADMHPIHFHLINMQKVKQFKFDVDAYTNEYFRLNGGMPMKHGFMMAPVSLDPQPYRLNVDEMPQKHQKVFKDTIDVHPGYVTVLRVKFAKNNGQVWKSFDPRGQRYVWHCHILNHEDNEMMKYFCLE